MGKFPGIRLLSSVGGILGGGSGSKSQAPISVPAPAVKSKKDIVKEEDKAANRLRVAEERKRGRRAAILSNISSEEAESATVRRPAGRAANVLFGS